MTDMPAQIGAYRVEREIGRGGMGVVYLARDTRLDRTVAVKTLPVEWVADADRLARFDREARSLAQLNHSNVAGIYGVEQQDGQRYLILEFVDGETLADRIAAGPIPIDEALKLAADIAAGIEAAHDAGVVHRDLKPENIKITRQGKAKVLDFGLAKPDDANSTTTASAPTATKPRNPTVPGSILGTAPYMSPEQARGRPVDGRSDIWSFGVILYEMLTGVSPFAGDSMTESIGAVLHKDIPLDRLPATVPPMVRHVVRTCVQRDLDRRYRNIGDARLDLVEAHEFTVADGAPTPGRARGPAIGAGVFGVAVGALATILAVTRFVPFNEAPAELRVERFEIPVPDLDVDTVVLAPDGSAVAYRADNRLWVRPLDAFTPTPIDGSEGGVSPFWSPDSQWIGFANGLALWKASASGTQARKIGSIPERMSTVNNATWCDDGQIVFGTNQGSIYEISSAGGASVKVLAPPAGLNDFHSIDVLPGGRTLLVTVHFDSDLKSHRLGVWDRSELQVFPDLGSPNINVGYGIYSSSGHILFEQPGPNAGVWAAPFSLTEGAPTGPPFMVAPRGGSPSVDDLGNLAYTRGGAQVGRTLAWVDAATGSATPLHEDDAEWLSFPSLSPKGEFVAFASHLPPARGIWIENLATGAQWRVTPGDTLNIWPSWSPDELRIAAVEHPADRPRVVFYAADGSGPVGAPVENADNPGFDGTWTKMVFQRRQDDSDLDIFVVDPRGGEPTPVITAPASQYDARLSPDGQWLAYTSEESGDPRVYLSRFPVDGGRGREISNGFGERAMWVEDGRLFFLAARNVVKVLEIDLASGEVLREPRDAIVQPPRTQNPYRGYAFDAKGDRFLVTQRVKEPPPVPSIAVVKNWAVEFGDR